MTRGLRRHPRLRALGAVACGYLFGTIPSADLTHAADEMGRIAAANALGRRRRRFDRRAIPWATFTAPEVGRVELTEAEAAGSGGRVAYLPFTELDRAIVTGDTRGFVKLIAGPRRLTGNADGGMLLGATVVGPTGGELIHEARPATRDR